MEKKVIGWKTKGMNRDWSVSSFNNEFAFENINLRLTTNEGNTLLSWVNEKGTKEITDISIDLTPWEDSDQTETSNSSRYTNTIEGTPIGTAVINHKLVVFTTTSTSQRQDTDFIYTFHYTNSSHTALAGSLIYKGYLGFSTEHPLETLVSYESSELEKVYWTDGYQQPRVINVAATKDKLQKWNYQQIQGVETYNKDSFFDFIPAIKGKEVFTVTQNIASDGSFSQGVIQYAFTYVNKFSQQSNIVETSPLYYIAFPDRGASPEERASCSFKIRIENTDTNFDYVRLYSIQRTSFDGEAVIKLIEDIPVTNEGVNTVEYIDRGITGTLVDPFELPFVGGKVITALTMAAKDQTLFMGNITQKTSSWWNIQKWLRDEYFPNIDTIYTYTDRKKYTPHFEQEEREAVQNVWHKKLILPDANEYYPYANQLSQGNAQDISTFKGKETYRLGIQFQNKEGVWSDPIFLKDVENPYYPDTILNNSVTPVDEVVLDKKDVFTSYGVWYMDIGYMDDHNPGMFNDFQKVRPVIVYPTIADRSVLCQGVLNPTVFNVQDRITNSPFAQASWWFRPYSSQTLDASKDTIPAGEVDYVFDEQDELLQGDLVEYGHYKHLYSTSDYSDLYNKILEDSSTHVLSTVDEIIARRYARLIEIEGSTDDYETVLKSSATDNTKKIQSSSEFFVDQSIVTLNSPDIEFDTEVQRSLMQNVSLRIIGAIPITSTVSAHRIDISSVMPQMEIASIGASSIDWDNITDIMEEWNSPHQGIGEENANIRISNLNMDSGRRLVSSFLWNDLDVNKLQWHLDSNTIKYKSKDSLRNYLVYPWQRTGSLNNDTGIRKDSSGNTIDQSSVLHRKKISNLHYSYNTVYLQNSVIGSQSFDTPVSFDGLNPQVVLTQNMEVTGYKLLSNLPYTYYPNIDKVLTHINGYAILSSKDLDPDNLKQEITEYWKTKITTSEEEKNALVNDGWEVINRYPTSFSVSVHTEYSWKLRKKFEKVENSKFEGTVSSQPVSMKYKSTSHLVVPLFSNKSAINILPYGRFPVIGTDNYTYIGRYQTPVYDSNEEGSNITFWEEPLPTVTQQGVDITSLDSNVSNLPYNYLWLGEIYRDIQEGTRFGGKSKEAIKANTWTPAGDAVSLYEEVTNEETGETTTELKADVALYWTRGDTYYQRYDCLKTYAFTPDDVNQNVEMLSFMCETHVNIDGRYDRNRGQISNYNIRPDVFNLLNPVYSQRDNFFSYKQVDTEGNDALKYPNHIYYSKTKDSGNDIDLWTNITLASMLELDGDKGEITSLQNLNNQLLSFQDTGISQILYNESVQISSQQGVPIEIANSQKVQGKRYLTDTIGCSNKWTIANTPKGIYFIDSNNKSFYLFNGQLLNLSDTYGFNAWAKQNIPASEIDWKPVWDSNNKDAFVTYYDRKNQDVLFINNSTCLAFSEKLGAFTSFYNYEDTPYFCNFEDGGVWINRSRDDLDSTTYKLWQHQMGDYCSFFDKNAPYSMTLIGNPDATIDKTFSSVEFRASVEGDGQPDGSTGKFIPILPFDTLETWNEYQHGIANLKHITGAQAMRHHTFDGDTSLKRKFRIWRCDIPRDNAPVQESDKQKGIYRFSAKPMDRMRNPWIYLKLSKSNLDEVNIKTELHDMLMYYFVNR